MRLFRSTDNISQVPLYASLFLSAIELNSTGKVSLV